MDMGRLKRAQHQLQLNDGVLTKSGRQLDLHSRYPFIPAYRPRLER